MPRTHRPSRAASVLALVAVTALSACGDDDADAGADGADTDGSTTTVDEAPPDGSDVEVVTVELSDFAFDGVPASVPAGTRLAVVNTSDAELHELIAVRVPDGEDRSVAELMELPDAELEAIFGSGPPATVLLAPPGGEQVDALGDGTLTEPGRYALVCFIPTGVDPDEYLAASGEGPPVIEGAGPPHVAAGMFAELEVTP